MTQSVSALDFKTVLPLRDDHQQLRKSANRMIRNLEEHDNQLKGLLEDSRQQIKNLKEDISKRLTYLRELSLFAVKIAKGDFSGHVPWTDSERFLAESLRQVQTQHQLACDILSALSKGDLTPEYSLNDEKDLLGKSLNSCLQAARDKETLLENTRNNYTELQNRHEETNLYINNITNYIRGLANGDYSLKEPQHENGKELFEALHQLKQNTKEISSIVLKAAAGDFQQEIPLRHQNDLLGSSLLQLFQSFDRYSTSFKNKISELSQKSADLQNQQSELLDYNIKFEGKYEDLVTQYESSIQQQKELSVDNDRLKRRNSVLEAENRDISRKYATVTKQFKSVEQKNEKLIRSNERNLKFISKFFPELKKSVQKYHKLVKNHENLLKIDSEKTLLKKMSTIQTEVENTLKFIAGASADFFSKAEPTALEITEIDLGKFLNKLDQQFKEIAVDKSITLSFNMEKTASLKISTDEIRFEQILNTLLTTALKTTEASAVQCRIFRAEDRKPQNEEQPRGTIGFEISTDAAGGPVNGHEIVFEAFQGIYAVKDSHSGETDLGLAMLRDLALLLKGEIHLHSIQGKGNTYLLLLPATFHPPEDSTEEKTAPQINIQEKTLLILEEDTAFITSFSQTARQRQYQCVVGNSADEALELLKKYSPCGVLLGMKWADEKGAKLIDQILSASYPHRIPFYAVSNIKVEVDGWRETMVGSLGKSPVPADITNALDRMES
ncbi:hypothetical protein KKA14_21610, partial [bacterium]|nr:hypothetical protein [bacterium]